MKEAIKATGSTTSRREAFMGLVDAGAAASVADHISPAAFAEHWQQQLPSAPYRLAGFDWPDYGPAYQFGYRAYEQFRNRSFEDIERRLAGLWPTQRGESRLDWPQARDAVRDGWDHVDHAMLW